MRRRRCLAFAGGASLAATAACLGDVTGGCPDPSLTDELEYEQHRANALFQTVDEGARLVTSADGVDEFDSEYATSATLDWARNTDFDSAVVVGIQVGSSGESSPLEVLGIERDSETTIRVHSCIEQRGATDDWAPYAQVIRVQYGDAKPTDATLTHYETGDTHVFEGTREKT